MRSVGSWLALACSVLVLGVGSAAPAAAFEGTLKWRMLKVGKEPLAKIAGDVSDADAVFEVPIDTLLKMHGDATVSEATMYLKGSKIRAENTAGAEYFLMDLETGTTEVVIPSQKRILIVTEQDVQVLEARGRAMKGFMRQKIKDAPPKERRKLEKTADRLKMREEAEEKEPEVVALSKKQTINGLSTTAFEVKSPQETVLGWVTREKPEVQKSLLAIGDRRDNMEQRRATQKGKDLLVREGVPVRVQTLDRNNYTVEDLIEVQEKILGDELFVAPAEYTRSNAADLRRAAEAGPQARPPVPVEPPANPAPPAPKP